MALKCQYFVLLALIEFFFFFHALAFSKALDKIVNQKKNFKFSVQFSFTGVRRGACRTVKNIIQPKNFQTHINLSDPEKNEVSKAIRVYNAENLQFHQLTKKKKGGVNSPGHRRTFSLFAPHLP